MVFFVLLRIAAVLFRIVFVLLSFLSRERVLQKLNARRSSKTPVEDHLSIVHENTQNFGIDKPTVQSPRETLNTILVRMLRRDVADVNRIPESCL